jgi:hypothetical protein
LSSYNGVSKLANVIHKKVSDTGAQSPVWLDFGEIQQDGSLKTNRFDLPIPSGDYLICRCAAHKEDIFTQTKADQGQHPHGLSGTHAGHSSGDGTHSHLSTEGSHIHDILRPDTMRAVKPGDRVLVAWVGNDPVVIDIIIQADEVI